MCELKFPSDNTLRRKWESNFSRSESVELRVPNTLIFVMVTSLRHTLQLSRFLVQNLPLSRFSITLSRFFSCRFWSLDLIIFSYFSRICKNVSLLDQTSHFFKNFVPLFASGRLVGMLRTATLYLRYSVFTRRD